MVEPIEKRVTRSLKATEELYHCLVLIVGKCGIGETCVIQNLVKLHKVDPSKMRVLSEG